MCNIIKKKKIFFINRYFLSSTKNFNLFADKSLYIRYLFIPIVFKINFLLFNIPFSKIFLSIVKILKILGFFVYWNSFCFLFKDKCLSIKNRKFLNSQNSASIIRILPSFLFFLNNKFVIYCKELLSRRPINRIENFFINSRKEKIINFYNKIFVKNFFSKIVFVNFFFFTYIRKINLSLSSAQVKSFLFISLIKLNVFNSFLTSNIYIRDHTDRIFLLYNKKNKNKNIFFIFKNSRKKFSFKKVFLPSCLSTYSFIVLFSIIYKKKFFTKNLIFNYTRTGFIDASKTLGSIIFIKNLSFLNYEPVVNLEILPSILNGNVFSKKTTERMIDEIQSFIILSLFSLGYTIIKKCKELIYKEINRIKYTIKEYKKFGAIILLFDDNFIIFNSISSLREGSNADSYGDHRLSICLRVLQIFLNKPLIISSYSAYKESFFNFEYFLNFLF